MDTTKASLLKRIKDRADGAAWEEFDSIYRPMLRRFARMRGLDPDDVEDVVQDCLAAISRQIQDFEYDPAKGRFKSWLRTLVNNRVRNKLRRRHEDPAKSSVFKRPQKREPAPDELFDALWLREHLRHCLERLRPGMQDSTYQAFHAYVIKEKPIEEVCRTLNMTPNQVNVIKWRVTSKLREQMKLLLGEE